MAQYSATLPSAMRRLSVPVKVTSRPIASGGVLGSRRGRFPAPYQGMLFNASSVPACASALTKFPPGRTCLALARKWRHILAIPRAD